MNVTMNINDRFGQFSRWCAITLGSPLFFVANCGLILVWLTLGPVYGYSDTWQLMVNTGTTVFTYLAVFVIQHTQNRDSKAVHLKLDELIHSIKKARNSLIDLEDLSDEEVKLLEEQFKLLRNEP